MSTTFIGEKKNTSFSFYAYRHKINGPKSNNDTDITFIVDQEQKQSLAPFSFIDSEQALKVTVEFVE